MPSLETPWSDHHFPVIQVKFVQAFRKLEAYALEFCVIGCCVFDQHLFLGTPVKSDLFGVGEVYSIGRINEGYSPIRFWFPNPVHNTVEEVTTLVSTQHLSLSNTTHRLIASGTRPRNRGFFIEDHSRVVDDRKVFGSTYMIRAMTKEEVHRYVVQEGFLSFKDV